jgi:hypothetical protein
MGNSLCLVPFISDSSNAANRWAGDIESAVDRDNVLVVDEHDDDDGDGSSHDDDDVLHFVNNTAFTPPLLLNPTAVCLSVTATTKIVSIQLLTSRRNSIIVVDPAAAF